MDKLDQQDMDKKQIYKCDPSKNIMCAKTSCFYVDHLGLCKYTTNPEFSSEGVAYSSRELFETEEKGKTLIIVQ